MFFFSRWEEVPKNFQSCQKSNNSTLTDCCTLCWRNFFSQDATHVLGKKNAGARRLIWTSRPMLVMSYMLKHCHRWLAGKKEPMMTCSCLVAADPAIWSWGPIIPSSCRIYPHSHCPTHDLTKGIFQVKSKKKTLVVSACRAACECFRFDLDSVADFPCLLVSPLCLLTEHWEANDLTSGWQSQAALD